MIYDFFSDYKAHQDKHINPALLWEYDLTRFDYQQMRGNVVQRVVERGWLNDWFAMLNLYGEVGVAEAIREIPYLNDKDLHFVSTLFQIAITEMKCYERKQLRQAHWNA